MVLKTKPFIRKLEWVARFIEARTSIPVLGNVLLAPHQGKVRLTATDLETAGVTDLEMEGQVEPAVTFPARKALAYLRLVEEPVFMLSVTPEHRLILRHGRAGSEAAIDGIGVESYPDLPKVPLTGELGGLTAALPRILMAISCEESRFTLNGALIAVNGTTQIISTDGHRLSYAEIEAKKIPAPFKALVPRFALAELAHLKDDRVGFGWDENYLRFKTAGGRSILTRKLVGNFPDWDRVLPKASAHAIALNATALSKVIERVAVFADKRSRCIRFGIADGTLTVRASVSETGSAKGTVPAPGFQGTWEGGFNADYLQDFLTRVDACEFRFSEPKDAAELAVPGWRYVCCPMRI